MTVLTQTACRPLGETWKSVACSVNSTSSRVQGVAAAAAGRGTSPRAGRQAIKKRRERKRRLMAWCSRERSGRRAHEVSRFPTEFGNVLFGNSVSRTSPTFGNGREHETE